MAEHRMVFIERWIPLVAWVGGTANRKESDQADEHGNRPTLYQGGRQV